MALSKKIRFEVFKRDKFTCQYCGRKAPEVVLHVDHIDPKSKGGKNTLLNLITSCLPCNLGKGARLLSDDSVLEKQRQQLEELQVRREQLEMMLEWQRSLVDLDTETTERAAQFWCDLVGWAGISAEGKQIIQKTIRKYGIEDVLWAMRRSVEGYVKHGDDDEPTAESRELAFMKIGAICHMKQVEIEKPYMPRLFYIRGIIKNRFNYTNLHEARQILEQAFESGGDYEDMREIAIDASSWSNWRARMSDYIQDLEDFKERGE